MACLNRLRTSDRVRSLLSVLACYLVTGAFCAPGTKAHAAPVTLAFEAQVTTISESPPPTLELPFEVTVGDTIQGRFRFEPAPIGSVGPQDLGIQFTIGGVMLRSPTYDIGIALNQLPPLDVPPLSPDGMPTVPGDGGSIEPVDLPFFDLIVVGCSMGSNQSQCDPGTVPGATNIEWRASMSLGGDSPILGNGDLIGDPNIWNQLNGRSLELSFKPVHLNGGVRISALVGTMHAVPEPSAPQFAALPVFSLFLVFGASRRRSGQNWLLMVMLVVAVCAAQSTTQAAQVTFAFDATVTEVNETSGGANLLPFQAMVGQHLSGVVTFTPVPFGETSANDAKLEVDWEGETFTAQSHMLATFNDHLLTPGSPFDALSVECGVADDCASSSTGVSIREFALVLRSFHDVLPASQLMDSVDAWNKFDDRQVLLFMSDVSDTRVVNIIASVGAMRAVPEPSAPQFAALPVFSLFLVFGASRRRSGQNWLLMVMLVVAVCAAQSTTQAAQVTFAFDATVTEVNETSGGANLLPFQAMVGQHLSGVVTFTPVPFGETSANDAKLEVAWEGETFTALSHKLTTLNNYGGVLGAPIDGLSVVCGAPGDCATSSSGATIREFSLGLGSFQDVIPAGQLMDTVETWNQFEKRHLLLFLRDASDTRRVSILASVGPMQAVPEPSSVLFAFCFGVSTALFRRLRRK